MTKLEQEVTELLNFMEMNDENNLVPHLKLTTVEMLRMGHRDLKASKKWFLNKSEKQISEIKEVHRKFYELRKEVLNY